MMKVAVVSVLILMIVGVVVAGRVRMEEDVRVGRVPVGWVEAEEDLLGEEIELVFALKQRNFEQLERALWKAGSPSSPDYGSWWTRQQVHELVAPLPEVVEEVKQLLEEGGAVSTELVGAGFLRAAMAVEQVEKLLQVHMRVFYHEASGSRAVRTLQGYSLPLPIAQHVQFVGNVLRFPATGRSDGPSIMTEDASRASFKTTPASIQEQYNVTIPPANSKNVQAVVSFLGQYFSPTDLAKFQQQNHLPNVPIAQVIGFNNPNKPGVEAELDVQFLTGVTNNTVETWVYSTNGTLPSGNEPFLEWLETLDSEDFIPYVFSISYQDLEDTVGLAYASRCNEEFAKHTMRGSTFFTGSGDWGVGCKNLGEINDEDIDCNKFNADFPSSSPYLVSLGSTTFSLFTDIKIGVAYSSGGFSNYFGQPNYQPPAINPYLSQSVLPPSSYYNATGRAFPDLSTIGVNFQVVVHGFTEPVAGTSASTPTFAAMISLINTLRLNANQPTMGFLQPFLYEAWQKQSDAYHDITSGQPQDHGCCGAAFTPVPGWDAYTGLGEPNWKVLSQLAMSHQMIPALNYF